MYCKKCGTEQKAGQKFCPKCGTPFVSAGSKKDETVSFNSGQESSEQLYTEKEDSQYIPKQSVAKNNLNKRWIVAIIALIAVIALTIWAWNKMTFSDVIGAFSSNKQISDIEGVPFKSTEKGKWGMLKPDGTILFEDEFKDMPTIARCGRFMVRNGNGLWEIFTATPNPEKIGEEYLYLGDFFNGIAPAVKKNSHITLIDKDGNEIAILDRSGSKAITQMENFHYGYAVFEAEDAVGIVNTKGEILLDAKKYCKILHVAPKRFLALDMKYKDEEDKHSLVFDVIDPVGNKKGIIRMSKYDDVAVLSNGYMAIEQTSDGEKLYGIIDMDGEVIVKPTSKIKGLYGFQGDKFIFSNGESLGVRNIDDEVLIRAKYDGIIWATDNKLWVNTSTDGRQGWSLIDLDGNKITKEPYQDVLPFFDGKHTYVQVTDKTWSMIDIDGDEMKNLPDIYTVSDNTADEVIISDYVDLDAIVNLIDMTPYGFGGFGINMSPVELIKVYNENCVAKERLPLEPNEVRTDKLSYQKRILNDIDFNVQLYYSMFMTEKGESHFDDTIGEWIQEPTKWTQEPPQYVKMTVSGGKLSGKCDLLYKKLAVKAKMLGKVYKENNNACIVVLKNNTGLILVNSGTEVWGMVKSLDVLRNENINQYSDQGTRTGDGYTMSFDTDSIESIIDDAIDYNN